ncbi:hypothetical protein [Actinoplanes regularis]|uniref:Uncharacterized protein n=1 Tax=Actinoplanes regularis TaxID=52697 RepID=A0A238YXT8_9ACTN|nr:hypothetical protein [Actinoplanes regularis]SNR75907.1 hypothetical protein SAMN06264365_105268 [Actinoplanes regularis]
MLTDSPLLHPIENAGDRRPATGVSLIATTPISTQTFTRRSLAFDKLAQSLLSQ